MPTTFTPWQAVYTNDTCQCYSYSSRGFIYTSSEVLIYRTCNGDHEKNDMRRGGGLCTVQITCNAGPGNKRESTV